MASNISRFETNPAHLSDDDTEDEELDLGAYLSLGSLRKHDGAEISLGAKTPGRIDKRNFALSMSKTRMRDKDLDSENRSGIPSDDTSPTKSKAMAKTDESVAKQEGEISELSSWALSSPTKSKRIQRPLKTAQINPLLLPASHPIDNKAKGSRFKKGNSERDENSALAIYSQEDGYSMETPKPQTKKSNNARKVSNWTTKKVNSQWSLNPFDTEKGDSTFSSLSDFIVSDNEKISLYESHGETEEDRDKSELLPMPRRRLIRGKTPKSALKKKDPTGSKTSASDGLLAQQPVNVTLPPSLHLKPTTSSLSTGGKKTPGKGHRSRDIDNVEPDPSSIPEDTASTMRGTVFVTPPSSPSKPRLKSPSKEKHRIPASPHRPSIDAFWSQNVVNEWNDQYSPKKEQSPFRRRIEKLMEDYDDNGDENSIPSPKKIGDSPAKMSPSKARAVAAAAKKEAARKKKEFDEQKVPLAEEFFKELDSKVTGGEIQRLAESTGGVKIIWSKKLNSTAGRANWKREVVKTKNNDGSTNTTATRHHATIELAEKVLDNTDRLVNTLAHEYCHLTNFMISNIRNNPHGTSFKEWARKTTLAFNESDHPIYGGGKIKVTTKHDYVISYKYVWCCEGCGLEYGRHSKSIDPGKVRCGRCKGELMQVKPKPRKRAENSPQKKKMEDNKDTEAEGAEVVDLLGEGNGDGDGVEAVTRDMADVKIHA